MKKKIIICALIVVIVAFMITACTPQQESDDVYAKINEMAKMEYQIMRLEVQTTYEGVTLVDQFTSSKGVNNTIVSYQKERLATIEQDEDGNYIVPEEAIVRETGSAEIVNGKIVSSTGDTTNIPLESVQSLSILFKKNYFSSVKEYAEGTLNVFSANVVDLIGFTGDYTFSGKDMSVEVRYAEKLSQVMIDYTSANGATIKVIYKFL